MSFHGNIACYCSSISWGGLEMNFLKHAKWIKERGSSLVFFCVNDSPLHKALKELEVEAIVIERNKKYFDFRRARALGKLLKQHQVDLVWIRDVRDMDVVGRAKSQHNFKLVYQQAMQLGVKKMDWIHTRRFMKIDAWISPLQYLAKQVKTMTRYPESRVHIIPLGIDTLKFESGLGKDEARKLLEIKSEGLIIGVIGRLDPRKGQLFLVNTIAELKEEGLSIGLLIVGEKTVGESDEYYKELVKTIDEKDLNSSVFIRPFMKDVVPFFRAIDCFIMASEGETFGMVTIESMITGTPIIGTNTSGTPEILENGDLGALYSPNKKEELKPLLHQLGENPSLFTNKATKAKEMAMDKYEKNIVCQKLEDLFTQILE